MLNICWKMDKHCTTIIMRHEKMLSDLSENSAGGSRELSANLETSPGYQAN